MTKKKYFLIYTFAIVLLAIHYLIYLITKNDEPFFFLLAFAVAAWGITSWIFNRFSKKTKI